MEAFRFRTLFIQSVGNPHHQHTSSVKRSPNATGHKKPRAICRPESSSIIFMTGSQNGISKASQAASQSIIPPTAQPFDDYSWIASDISSWLDTEYIPQQCHKEIGQLCLDIYAELVRNNPEIDMSDMVLELVGRLEQNSGVFEDAFVGPFDVANKVSDMMFRKMGAELCSCDMPVNQSLSVKESLTDKYATLWKTILKKQELEIDKYLLKRELLEAADLDLVDVMLWMVLGYEPTGDFSQWDSSNLKISLPSKIMGPNGLPPVFSASAEAQKVLSDIIESQEVDVFDALHAYVEILVGEEYYKVLRNSDDAEFRYRDLAVRFMRLLDMEVL